MKKIIFYKNIVFCLLMSVTTTGCNRDKNNGYDENVAKEKFCSCLNVENIDQTIPVVNEFLSGLSDGLNDEQQLQELTAWLKSCSCIIDATVFCKSCVETNPPKSQIAVSFDENGTTKNFILEITMSTPLKAAGYQEYIEPEEDFCSFLNEENIDKTIPFVDDFLSSLLAIDDQQQLQALAAWLKSQPCIIDAAVYGEINPTTSEISISFDENGTTKNFILEITMSNPLRAAGYHEYKKIPSWDYFLPGNWTWDWDMKTSEVIVLNSNEDIKKYICCGGYIMDFPEIDFSEYSMLVVSGATSNTFGVSYITGSLHQHANRYELHIEISRNDSKEESRWFFTLMTNKLSEEISIETVISYTKYEGENYYYYWDEKIFIGQRADKIFLKLASDVSMEQAQTIINSDASLRLVFVLHFEWEDYFRTLKETGCILETKDGKRVPSTTLESLQAREEVVFATYMFQGWAGNPFAFTNEFSLMLKPTTSYAQLQALAERYNCTLIGDPLQKGFTLYVSSKSSALQMANLFQETGLFEYSAPYTIRLITNP